MRLDAVIFGALALYAATCAVFIFFVYPQYFRAEENIGQQVAQPEPEVDLYSILELPRGEESSEAEIKKQFRSLSRKYHPDLNPDSAAREKFRSISKAYEVLGDRKRRKIYDLKGEEGLRMLEQDQEGRGRPRDPFAALFGMQSGGSRGREMRLHLQLPLEDFYTGKTHEITIHKNKLCRKCKGTGAKSPNHITVCPQCRGHGVILQRVQVAPGFVQQFQQQCPRCGGHGKMVTALCPVCEGRVLVRGEATLEVTIEPGSPDGYDVVFEMEGDESTDTLPGDVVVSLQSRPHPIFRRDKNDLHTSIEISLVEAVAGFTRQMTHMDGHEFTIANEGVTQAGSTLVVRGEGMPRMHVPSEHGDLFVLVTVRFPRRISPAQAAALTSVLDSVH
eukprot:TRINITY_DN9367_c0_g1_i1.p1 TRINITY_DN9367_c0_g1~~TRINITY_DN9367_c0_g1_i1.p1  ORF type:complete len:390 (+),score=52.45 TRINITY_DN9367_c0_g1_i1:41-1210(+)